MNLIIDTNIWLDLLVFKDPRAAILYQDLEQGRVTCHRTAHMMAELADVLSRPQFKLDEAGQDATLKRAHALSSEAFAPPPDVPQANAANPASRPPKNLPLLICRDPDDQPFLDLALALPAQVILSKDKALLRLASKARQYNLIISQEWPLKTKTKPQASPLPD